MGLKAAVQALQKAEKLKEKVQCSRDLLNDNDAWICQQQLQRIYQQVLILDLEYALDRKVEQDLWSHGFKNYIGSLQALAKDKKNPKRSESQAMLSWCLEAASGFYLTLLQDICTAFDLDLPFRRKGSVYGSNKQWTAVEELNPPQNSSCNYICQHCLVHLGDIARYRNQSRQAEAFYRHAVLPAPSNGHPYNQLALLEASRGDRLSTVFHYVRSVAVRFPFQAAATNLTRTLNKSVEERLNVDGRPKLSAQEYVAVFLKLHGLLHSASSLDTAEKCVKLLTTTLTAHIATESLTSWKLVQMLVINLFALHHAGSCVDANRVVQFRDDQLSADERRVKKLVTDLLAGSLSAFLLPVYTLKEGESMLEYFALPAIKLTLDWIRLDPKVLAESAFTNRLQIWPSLCKLLNGMQPLVAEFNADKFECVPLPEDRDLQCFVPLEQSLSSLRFACNEWKSDPPLLNRLRAHRLVAFGLWLADQPDGRLVAKKTSPVGNATTLLFEAIGGQQVPPSDLIRELEELSLSKLSSPAPSESSSWGSSATGASTPDHLSANAGRTPPSPAPEHVDATQERRAGILKPQGSLEKSRDASEVVRESVWPAVVDTAPPPPVLAKRGRQNVAMQAIMRKANSLTDSDGVRGTESKQVTFKSPSPPAAKTQPWPLKATAKPQPTARPPANGGHSQPTPVIQRPNMFASASDSNLTAHQQQNVPPRYYPNPPPQFAPSIPPLLSNPVHDPRGLALGQPPPARLYSPWTSAADNIPMPPTAWCGADRRIAGPPGMDQRANDFLGNHGHGNNRNDEFHHEAFANWNIRPDNVNSRQRPVGDFAAHQRYAGDYVVARPSNGAVTKPEVTAYGDRRARRQEPDGLPMFSPGLGTSAFGGANTYSLFSNSNWAAPAVYAARPENSVDGESRGVVGMAANGAMAVGQQSLWSGPGPSPLERLLEQQKQLREGPAPKGGT